MPVWKQRRGTAAALTAANETPAEGQLVWEIDTNRLKVGTGVTTYTQLAYLDNEITISEVNGLQATLDGKQVAGSYAALVHTHTIANVTGLQAELDGKAALVHTHSTASITGLGTASAKNVAASGNASGTDVVMATDTRLSDQRTPADGSVVAAKLHSALKIDGGQVT